MNNITYGWLESSFNLDIDFFIQNHEESNTQIFSPIDDDEKTADQIRKLGRRLFELKTSTDSLSLEDDHSSEESTEIDSLELSPPSSPVPPPYSPFTPHSPQVQANDFLELLEPLTPPSSPIPPPYSPITPHSPQVQANDFLELLEPLTPSSPVPPPYSPFTPRSPKAKSIVPQGLKNAISKEKEKVAQRAGKNVPFYSTWSQEDKEMLLEIMFDDSTAKFKDISQCIFWGRHSPKDCETMFSALILNGMKTRIKRI